MNISLVNRFLDDTAFILDSRASLMLSLLLADTQLAEHPYLKEEREVLKPEMTVDKDGIAHVPVHGVLAYAPTVVEMKFFGVEDSRNILSMVNKAKEDSGVKGVLLHVHSPGGMKTGGFEVADAVAATNKIKPVVAHIGGIGASMAYGIASQAGEVIANRTAQVGSIGGFAVVVDRSRLVKNMGLEVEVFKNKEAKYKAIGTIGTSLSDDQKQHLKDTIQGILTSSNQ
jgi:signal peptide peptidase SppA